MNESRVIRPAALRAQRASRAAYQRVRYKLKYAASRAMLDGLKNVPCQDCGGRFPPECMDFDHVRGEKLFGIGANVSKVPLAKLMAEIEKCELVCANCHRIRTKRRRHEAAR